MYFETIKCEDEEVFNLDYHKQRIARTIGLNIDLQEYVYPPSKELLKCKITYSKTGIADVTYTPYKKRNISKLKLVYDDHIIYDKKSTNRDDIDKLYRLKGGCDDIIIVKNGLITDTSIANIAIKLNDVWYTPKKPLLYGTTRARFIHDGKIHEKDLTIDDYNRASNVALLNAMIGFNIIS